MATAANLEDGKSASPGRSGFKTSVIIKGLWLKSQNAGGLRVRTLNHWYHRASKRIYAQHSSGNFYW